MMITNAAFQGNPVMPLVNTPAMGGYSGSMPGSNTNVLLQPSAQPATVFANQGRPLRPAPTSLVNAASSYNYPLTSGLLSSMNSATNAPSMNSATNAPSTNWNAIALGLAGNPHAGPYAQTALPSGIGVPGVSTATNSGSSTGTSLLGALLGLGVGSAGLSSLLGGSSGANNSASLIGALGNVGTPIGNALNTLLTGVNINNPNTFNSGNVSALSSLSSPDLSSINSQLQTDNGFTSSDSGGSFSGAGGQAASQNPLATSAISQLASQDPNLNLSGSTGTNLGGLIGSAGLGATALAGLLSGKPQGYAQAGIGGAQLAAQNPSLLNLTNSQASTLGGLSAAGGSALGILQGLQTGGVSGDTQAAINAARLAAQGAQSAGLLSSTAGNAIGSGLGYVAAPLAIYDALRNYQSGATGSDALNGAEAGAAVGTAVAPGFGTAVGGLIGGAVGAISSLFGGGKADPESLSLHSMDSSLQNSYSQLGAPAFESAVASAASPAQATQLIQGALDASGGARDAIEGYVGRGGSSAYITDVMTQVNNALKSGAITPTTPASQIYSQVVAPYLNSVSGGNAWNQTGPKGSTDEAAIEAGATQSLINAFLNGSLTNATKIGISGQTDPNLPALY